ncbi:2Fe-2S iron-sulfur cluster-binding protein [Litorivivens sp.]|uniref:2Fe-2S iron-sulfur cluster-binding protein n=1 Tax=Litorivivens sp. TaxID=2020868 RepID=UPI003568CBDE
MIEVKFIEHSGEVHEVTAESGASLMQAALNNSVPGIDADCGGGCACGTCHVIVSPEWIDKVGSPNETEAIMLQMTPEGCERSRLSCQLQLNDELNGLVVELPEFQM